ncbi:T9SS type A sorting domain-containing protein [candidate division KSB1 bacterium]|nr:T9SS type A sorting domain-containing protein [candidate division KSB1 bacterium]
MPAFATIYEIRDRFKIQIEIKEYILNKQLLLSITLLFYVYSISFATQFSGKVTDLNSGDPIDSAHVLIIDETTGSVDSAFSDANGEWTYDFNAIGIDDETTVPRKFSVAQNYPNPFNPSTIIQFENPAAGLVQVSVYNVLGQQIDSRQQFLQPGQFAIKWSGTGGAGIYFYSVRAAGKTVTRKMIQLDGGKGSGLSEFYGGDLSRNLGLLKPSSYSVQLIISRFGYVSDTVSAEIDGGEYLETPLETVHSHSLVIDLHNDVLERIYYEDQTYHLKDRHTKWHTDIPRLQEGGVDIQFFVVWEDYRKYPYTYYDNAFEMIDIFNAELAANPNTLAQVRSPAEALAANAEGKVAGVMAVEGGHVIENSIEKLIDFYEAGMRYMTITWNNSTDWAVSAQDNRSRTVGLTDFGRKVIRTMDSLGVIIDISHTGIKTIEDILEVTENPIVATHSGVRSLKDHYRNLYDDQIRAIAESGGVVGIVFYPPFIGRGYVSIETVIAHIDYIVDLVGIDYVALGSDFDGIGDNTIVGLRDVTDFPDLTLALLEHGYSQEDVEKINGLNFMRVFETVCGDSPVSQPRRIAMKSTN